MKNKNVIRKRQWLDKIQPLLTDPKTNVHEKNILWCEGWKIIGITCQELKNNLTIIVERLTEFSSVLQIRTRYCKRLFSSSKEFKKIC